MLSRQIEDLWLAQTDPQKAIFSLPHDRFSERRWLRFACACARRAWPLVAPDAAGALDALEALANGSSAGPQTLDALKAVRLALTRAATQLAGENYGASTQSGYLRGIVSEIVLLARIARAAGPPTGSVKQKRYRERRQQRRLLRDIVGNPFRPVPLELPRGDPRAEEARQIARVIDAERRFADLPILADALEDAGCEVGPILAHCRSGEAHWPGCWVIDAILGRL